LATGCVDGAGDAVGVYVSVLPAAGSAACAVAVLVDVGVIEVMGEVLLNLAARRR
jgi:spore maturation protein SpmB